MNKWSINCNTHRDGLCELSYEGQVLFLFRKSELSGLSECAFSALCDQEITTNQRIIRDAMARANEVWNGVIWSGADFASEPDKHVEYEVQISPPEWDCTVDYVQPTEVMFCGIQVMAVGLNKPPISPPIFEFSPEPPPPFRTKDYLKKP